MPECTPYVRPADHGLVEPAHTLYINGVAQTIVYLYFTDLMQCGISTIHVDIRLFLESWCWPHGVPKRELLEVWDPKRVKSWREALKMFGHSDNCVAPSVGLLGHQVRNGISHLYIANQRVRAHA
jgi:hypothetical protein